MRINKHALHTQEVSEMLLTCVAGVCVGVRLGWGWTWDVTKKILDLRVQKHVHFAKERGQDKE